MRGYSRLDPVSVIVVVEVLLEFLFSSTPRTYPPPIPINSSTMAMATATPMPTIPDRFRLGLELEICSVDGVALGFCVLISGHRVLSFSDGRHARLRRSRPRRRSSGRGPGRRRYRKRM